MELKSKIKQTLATAETINMVDTPEDLNHRIKQRLLSEEKDVIVLNHWFKPELQVAALVIVMLANIYVISQFQDESTDENISEFAQMYDLGSNDENYFN
ncbi:MAG: hypothetical protein ACWA5P_08460 [bacterium]